MVRLCPSWQVTAHRHCRIVLPADSIWLHNSAKHPHYHHVVEKKDTTEEYNFKTYGFG